MLSFDERVLVHVSEHASEAGDAQQRTDKDSLKSSARRDTVDKRQRTLRGITKAVSLAAKLSPKSQRKDKAVSNIAELKVCVACSSLSCDSYSS